MTVYCCLVHNCVSDNVCWHARSGGTPLSEPELTHTVPWYTRADHCTLSLTKQSSVSSGGDSHPATLTGGNDLVVIFISTGVVSDRHS